jgi:glycosyltransferase involved in cell wall biosynthesis
MLKLSIITINLNNFSGLEKTIQSVIDQTFKDYEYIVIDGNSMDGSVEIIKKYSSGINYWISEPDTGIYNAMNKGIRKAQGEYCLFLNSSDYLISSATLQDVFNEISNMNPADIFYSDLIRTDGILIKYPNNLSIKDLVLSTISHQNSLIKRSLFYDHGFYNEDLIIASDWEFFLYEFWKYKSNFIHIKTNISIFDINGISFNNTPERSAENITIIQNVFNELADLIIEYKYFHDSPYHTILETYNKTKLLFFLLKLYRFITFKSVKSAKIRNIFFNFYIIRLVQRLFKLIIRIISNIYIYIFEIITSIFDKKTRICFINFGNIPYGFFITPIHKVFEACHHSYKIVKYYNPHIHFFSVFGNKKIIHSKTDCKIFFSGENVNDNKNHYGEYKGNCVDNASLSLGFDYLEAENYLRFPLWLLYYFTPDNSKDEIRNTLNNFKKHYQKVKFCSLVASHDRSGIRTKIYNKISKIAPVDCPASFLHNDDTLHKQYADNKTVYLQQYKFNICPENSVSQGYVTEKLFQSLYSGCIPIYNGWSKNPEPDIVNPNIILMFDENDESSNISLINEIKTLYQNDRLYRSFMDQPFFCDTAVDKIYIMLQSFMHRIQYSLEKTLKIKNNF